MLQASSAIKAQCLWFGKCIRLWIPCTHNPTTPAWKPFRYALGMSVSPRAAAMMHACFSMLGMHKVTSACGWNIFAERVGGWPHSAVLCVKYQTESIIVWSWLWCCGSDCKAGSCAWNSKPWTWWATRWYQLRWRQQPASKYYKYDHDTMGVYNYSSRSWSLTLTWFVHWFTMSIWSWAQGCVFVDEIYSLSWCACIILTGCRNKNSILLSRTVSVHFSVLS